MVTGLRDADDTSAHDDVVAPTRARRRDPGKRRINRPEPQRNPFAVTAPSDGEVYEYLGPQMRWIHLFLIAAFVLAAWSLATFATAHPMLWPALVVLALNVIGTTFSTLTGVNRRRITWRTHQELVTTWTPPDVGYPAIDVFLPTCGEHLEILENTYRHIRALSWAGPLSVYVLDDAARPDVESLAAGYGFGYIVRPDRGHLRKAGNLRHAFGITDGDFIAIFDADFCPRRDFLQHLVPYLDDPAVAIVQSPQCFATVESMTWVQRTAGATQEYFYRWVQPSRDSIGAANCVGTSALYRRTALAEVGGFAAIEHSEDLHTGRHLQQAGHTIRYVPLVLSRGLCPTDLAGFLNQQYRWCQGTLSRLSNPQITQRRRMTVLQTLANWAGLFYYLTTALNVFLLFLPGIIMAAFFPDDVAPRQLVPFLLGLWVYVVLLPLVSRTRWRFEVLRIQLAYSYSHTVAIWHKIIGREIGWVPTAVVGASNSLARSISLLGTVALGGSLAAFWVVIARDIYTFGLWKFWMMAGFVLAYTYLAGPLLVQFVRVLVSGKGTEPQVEDHTTDLATTPRARYPFADGYLRPRQTKRRPIGPNWNRITVWEVVGYTVTIAFLGALALGWFDIMLPWSTT